MAPECRPSMPDDGIYIIENADAVHTPAFFNIPHSGEHFPAAFLERVQLPRQSLRRASDLFVDELMMPAARHGLPIMRALLPRSYVDLNREPFELDPRLIAGPLPIDANTRSLRVAGGLGTVPRVIGDQIEIYAGKISLAEALGRIEGAYVPYHLRLHQELMRRHQLHGHVVLIDLHSMPSQIGPRPGRSVPDIVLGDRFGTSCAPEIMAFVENAARRLGFSVEQNQPYAGGYITEHYGRPLLGWHAVQIEISRALYMDEANLLPNKGFSSVSEALTELALQISAMQAFENRKTALHFSQKAAE